MSETKLKARPALYGAKAAAANNTSVEIVDTWTMALVAERKGQGAALNSKVQELFGLELPGAGRVSASSGITAVWAGPGQWLLIASSANGRDLERDLRGPLDGIAAVADQSDSRAVVKVSGPKAREALAKGIPIDLHPKVFKAGDAAITHASHIGVTLWRPLDGDEFVITCATSYAGSFWHWLSESCQSTGMTVR